MISEIMAQRVSKIKAVVVDNDGVLTDGRIVFGDYGDELKFFDVQDGFGLVLLKRAGLITAILSAKKCRINKRRAKELQVTQLYQDAKDKLKVFEKFLKKFKLNAEDVCYVGDDLIDIPVLSRVGFAVAVSNAVEEVKRASEYVTERSGGRGAVREVADLILKSNGKWDEVTKRYFQ